MARRRVFISFYGGDKDEVLEFVREWGPEGAGVFTPRILLDTYNQEFVDSGNADYVIGRIRKDYIGDSTITVLLLGTCTHSRRYVDWELKASLRQGEVYQPNGLLGISLLSAPSSLHLPDRFKLNWDRNNDGARYARWYGPPGSAAQLADWIEEAFEARLKRANLIDNPQGRMEYNGKCKVHKFVTH